MQIARKHFSAATALALLLGSLSALPVSAEQAKTALEEGKELAFNRKKGNCLACHRMDDGVSPGNIGPPLLSMPARFPDKAKLRAQIYDSTALNPHSMMPPFGKHGALTAEEIDKIVEYIYTL